MADDETAARSRPRCVVRVSIGNDKPDESLETREWRMAVDGPENLVNTVMNT